MSASVVRLRLIAVRIVLFIALLIACAVGVGAGPACGSDGPTLGLPASLAFDGPTSVVPSEHTDPACVDGAYEAVLPAALVTEAGTQRITALMEAFDQATEDSDDGLVGGGGDGVIEELVLRLLTERYPFGRLLVAEGIVSDFGNCVAQFIGDARTAQDVVHKLHVLVHECGHFHDAAWLDGRTWMFRIDEERRFRCSSGASAAGGGDTFARSLLRGDRWGTEILPGCLGSTGAGPGGEVPCDRFAGIYLEGDPSDAEFQPGDQGFDTVLEEAVQYVNALAVVAAMEDRMTLAVDARDGVAVFLGYVLRYLHHARLEDPTTWSRLSSDACWREAILTLWGRAWFYLELTADSPVAGIRESGYLAVATDPELVAELDRLRVAHGCEGD